MTGADRTAPGVDPIADGAALGAHLVTRGGRATVVTLKIDGRTIRTDEEASVLEAARDAGIHIPTLCHHPALDPFGACRLCIVELERGGRKGHVASCVTPVQEGAVVRTNTRSVRLIRRTLLDLLLARCPDIEILQELAAEYGVTEPSYPVEDEICFLCGLCVRACREIVGIEAIGFTERGAESKVVPPFSQPSSRCIGCGTCTTVCPARTLELSAVDSVGSMHGESGDSRTVKCRVCDEHYMNR